MSRTQSKLTNQHSRWTFLAAGFLIISLVFVAITFFLLASHAKTEQRWASLSTDVQITSQQLARFAAEAAFGKRDAFLDIDNSHEKMLSALEKLRVGSDSGELPPIPPAADVQMNQLNQACDRMSASVSRILEYNDQALQDHLAELRGAADDIFLDSRDVFIQSSNLKQAIAEWSTTRIWPSLATAAIGLAAMIGTAWLLFYLLLTEARRQALSAATELKKNEQAVLTLAEEMKPLSNGDLTVQASATGGFTSNIAGAFNFAIDQLRELVRRISHTSQEVASTALQARAYTSELVESANLQAKQAGQATESVQEISLSIDAMAKRSLESSETSQSPADIAHLGGEKAREMIDRMTMIQEQVQQTAIRIKRLAESTQAIRDSVAKIKGFADQINMLALNAAIQSASAGGGGKGFAETADEVHQLAESTTDAAARVGTLVQTIQTDAHEAAVALESTTSEMLVGTSLAEDARTSLEQVEMLYADLSNLILGITEESNNQSSAAMEIHGLMKNIQEVSMLTAEDSTRIASSVERVDGLAMQLGNSVAKFRLPEEN